MKDDALVQQIIDFAEKFYGKDLPVYQKETVKLILQWEDEKAFKKQRDIPCSYFSDGQKKPHLVIIDDFEDRKDA